MNRTTYALPLITVAVLLSALAEAQPRAVDPCALLTTEEVSSVMDQAVEPGRATQNGVTPDGANSTTCLWTVPLAAGVRADPTKSLGGRSFAILNVMNWGGGATDARKFLDSFRKAFESRDIGSKPVPVEIGADEALWWGDGVAGRKNSISFGISVALPNDRASRQPKAESLAKLIVKRLPKSQPAS